MRRFYSFIVITLLAFFVACSGSSKLNKRMTEQDRSVFALLDQLKKNPADPMIANMFKSVYDSAVNTKSDLIKENLEISQTPDTWANTIPDLQILQKMRNEILANPAALKVVPNPQDFTKIINKVRNKAAEGYYNQGMEYLNYNNRSYGKMAYDAFSKANNMIPGYNDVVNRMRIAKDMATVKVVVEPVNYFNYGYSYWGLNEDYLQQKMVDDLNRMSYNDVKFYTDWQARTQHIQVDRVVNLNMNNIYIGNVSTNKVTYSRSKQIQTGQTNANPPQPIYQTVKATVTVTKRLLVGDGNLQCRIYDPVTNRNILYDNYPGNYQWVSETATYRGDSRALEPEDLVKINNNYSAQPARSEITTRIINQSYDLLLRRIKNGISFDNY